MRIASCVRDGGFATGRRRSADATGTVDLIHDVSIESIAAELLNRVLREEFVRIYSEPVFQRQPRYPPGPLFALFFRVAFVALELLSNNRH